MNLPKIAAIAGLKAYGVPNHDPSIVKYFTDEFGLDMREYAQVRGSGLCYFSTDVVEQKFSERVAEDKANMEVERPYLDDFEYIFRPSKKLIVLKVGDSFHKADADVDGKIYTYHPEVGITVYELDIDPDTLPED